MAEVKMMTICDDQRIREIRVRMFQLNQELKMLDKELDEILTKENSDAGTPHDRHSAAV